MKKNGEKDDENGGDEAAESGNVEENMVGEGTSPMEWTSKGGEAKNVSDSTL